ncbi:MAG: hypothetical protein FWG67_01785, partial [Defluviitaleaceae bacterium]|nr:hypothetical protein [Defluviitaleaceae bacterium]
MKRLSWIRNLLIVVLLIATVVHVNPIAALVNAVGEPQVGHARLIDFEGEYELPDDDSPVSVLVLFEHEPATVQVVEAEAAGAWLLEAEAVQNVEDDHERFRAELSRLFGREGDLLPEHTPPYDIVWEYRIGLNGVNLVLPANKVAELASFESVQLVIPNVTLTVELPVMEPTIDAVVEPALDVVEAPLSGNPWGMRPGRTAMGADVLHAAGYRG